MAKRKDKKAKKGKKRASKPRGLPTAVKGLLQYLGGQDATLQQTRPRGGAATGQDTGDTLSRYLAAKTAALESMRQQAVGVNLAQQVEEKLLAKRQTEESEKKIAMLSAGLKESDVAKKKAIAEQQRKIDELDRVVKQQGVEQLFREMQKGFVEYSLPSQAPSVRTPSEPYFMRAPMSEYSYESQMEGEAESLGGGGGLEMGSSAASEIYRQNAPLERPIIRDKPRSGGGAAAAPRKSASPKTPAPPAPQKSATQISAADLKSRISEVTGLAKSRYKLPSRKQYGGVQAALQNVSASSADMISALKEAGVNLMEA